MSLRYSRNNDGGKILARRRRSVRGFTLIELVVVIGLILILVGLTMAVGVAIRAQSETRQTENVLILLDQAVNQWEIAADRQLSWGIDNTPTNLVYDVQGDVDGSISPEVQLEDLLRRISTNQSARDILAQIDNDFLQQDDDAFLRLVDPWGKQVCLIHPGRVADFAVYGDILNEADLDGTVRTYHENVFGIAANRILLFVSAGPDGEFGDLSANPESNDFKQTQDNVYSYQPRSIEGVP